ncbi:MAG: transglycosylase SLT domain-containing protein [Gemmatimonadetes bacterium]|nr:transglycosylase SLT domain-containing protein [Gemmatimonadota bacterium]
MVPAWVVAAYFSLCGSFCDPVGGVADGALLRRFADSAGVPLPIALAVATVESGQLGGNHWRGRHGEVGRMQIRPRIWRWSFQQECGPRPLTDYVTNVCKGMFILKHWYGETGSWAGAVRRYNGRGIKTRTYLAKVTRELKTLSQQGLVDPGSLRLLVATTTRP